MKTNKDFITLGELRVVNPEAYEKAIGYTMSNFMRVLGVDNPEEFDDTDFKRAFLWRETSEGYEYWEELYFKYLK